MPTNACCRASRRRLRPRSAAWLRSSWERQVGWLNFQGYCLGKGELLCHKHPEQPRCLLIAVYLPCDIHRTLSFCIFSLQ